MKRQTDSGFATVKLRRLGIALSEGKHNAERSIPQFD